MFKILCTEPGNATYREWVKGWGFDGIRFDIPLYCPPEIIENTFAKIAQSSMPIVPIVGGWSRWEPRNDPAGRHVHDVREAPNINDAAVQASLVTELSRRHGLVSYIEGGNEPDITDGFNDGKEAHFVDFCNRLHEAIIAVNPMQPFITGGPHNMAAGAGLTYLRRALDAGLITGKHRGNIFTGIHPYRTGDEPWEPVDGADVRSVIQSIKREAGPVACTEIGWHTAMQKRSKGFLGLQKERFRFDDEDVLEFAKFELDLWAWAGSPVFCWYNANKGPSDKPIDNFGIRPFNHELGHVENQKTTVVVEAFQGWKYLDFTEERTSE